MGLPAVGEDLRDWLCPGGDGASDACIGVVQAVCASPEVVVLDARLVSYGQGRASVVSGVATDASSALGVLSRQCPLGNRLPAAAQLQRSPVQLVLDGNSWAAREPALVASDTVVVRASWSRYWLTPYLQEVRTVPCHEGSNEPQGECTAAPVIEFPKTEGLSALLPTLVGLVRDPTRALRTRRAAIALAKEELGWKPLLRGWRRILQRPGCDAGRLPEVGDCVGGDACPATVAQVVSLTDIVASALQDQGL
jgi:hypothetical protein